MPTRSLFSGWNILIVDDSQESLNILQVILEHSGASVTRALNGAQAVRAVQAAAPHLIITDLAMPVMDGWELIERLKQDDATSRIPIIVLTAHALADDRRRAIEAGCNHFVTKPIIPTGFIHELMSVIASIPQLNSRQ